MMAKEMFKQYLWTAATRWRMFKGRQLPAWISYASIWASSKFRKQLPCPKARDRHMLLLAGHFPPEVTGGIYRPVSFASHVSMAGWEVDVITDPRPETPSEAGRYMESLIPQAVRVHRIQSSGKEWHPWPLPDVDRGIVSAMAVYKTGCALMANTAPGVIVATGPSFHSFIAGMWLSERFGWRLVLDYRDEWTETPHAFAKKDKVNRNWEEKCLLRADRVIFTTQSQLTHQTKVFNKLRHEKCVVIHNGWKPDDFIWEKTEASKAEKHQEKEMRIAFLGNLGNWFRVGDFLAALGEVLSADPELRRCVKLQFVGQRSPEAMLEIERFPYQEVLSISDLVPKKTACQMMQRADALLLMNPPSWNRYIQGKTYEYIASGTPILILGEGGEMASIVKELDAGIVVPYGEVNALEKALHRIGSHVSSQKEKLVEWLQSRTREAMASKMLNLLEELRGSS